MSQDCRDLLLRLLERRPDARITFAEFFSHPFVDLEHMPSADSLATAVRAEHLCVCPGPFPYPRPLPLPSPPGPLPPTLGPYPAHRGPSSYPALCVTCVMEAVLSLQKKLVLQAVEEDQAGEWAAALSHYRSALEHLVPAIHCKVSS